MTAVLNHYSYLVAASALLLAVGWWAFRRRSLRSLVVLLLAALVVVGGDLAFRPGDASVVDAAALDAVLAGGRPAMVEFYSNY